ncbi:Hsp20/alpha crystallin family protein [Ferrovum sp. PN-J185]|uniref:Hsp20/alpha crystallin family protein n=1 Tax=Ferrovum sp. PN-J185 TaxID=1356306 RepID=UPI00079804B1|nr:Hsp20/alpha crystallin family protein [Ferrovum sp. PN-J185]KXW56734.1 acid shock protein [Ferrovum sp. PN-J185]MCC6067581.1 Hsp20/alpha crystallin family protein [Ferrovum sp. PN-J185]MDE1892059.1 Hsp20/alpha crystallin family protein [Betaproteobacteria bacterium]MDE2056492.1 Hsp20/alpha crystallin family protein [Betaproteobacteria bacterium]
MSQLSRLSKDLFGDFFSDYPSLGYLVRPLHGDTLPSTFNVDISENNDAYVIRAELPGVQKENININIDDKNISISAEIKQEDKKTEDEKVIRSECYYGSVSRSFSLPTSIDQKTSNANYENGILVLTLSKKSGTNGMSLKIN